jgi:tRNA A37 threonylcarbamoyladenosine modification protein TsaB
MSWLFIDTHAPGQLRVGWLGEEVSIKTYPGRASGLLLKLPSIRKLKREANGICVVAGPGSFSSVRTGVLYANLLSRLLRVPLVGISVDESKDLDALRITHYALRSTEYVAPVYDAEPNITIPKSS